MEACKIIFILFVCGYYADGHYLMRNYNNQRSPSFPSLNFQTFPEYFKPLYRIRYLPPSTTTANRIQPHTPKPTNIGNNIKKTAPLKQNSHGMLSIIKNVMKPLMRKKENPYEMNRLQKGRDTLYEHHRNHAIHLKLLPKLVKKEVAEQLGTIFGKVPKDTVINNTKQEVNKTEEIKVVDIDLSNNKENTTTEHVKLNETSDDEIKKKTGYINKIEAKSIFGNFVGNKHFANIFIFYPNNDNSALVVGLKDNLTQVFTENPVEILTKTPIDQFVDKISGGGKEENQGIENDDNNLDGTKDNESSNDKNNNTDVPTEATVTTDDIFLTSAATTTATSITINQDKDADTDDDENDLSGNKDLDESFKDIDSKTTEDSLMTSVPSSTTTELFDTSSDEAVADESTESPFNNTTEKVNNKEDDVSTVPTSTVENESESSSENVNDVKDESEDKQTTDEDNIESNNEIKEDDIDSTVASTTVPSEETESTSENLIEKLNDNKDDDDDIINEVNVESTVAPDIIEASTTENANDTNTEVPTSTVSHTDTTNTESESSGSLESTTEPTTINLEDTLSTVDAESTTQNIDKIEESENSVEGSSDGDYMEIEYTYF